MQEELKQKSKKKMSLAIEKLKEKLKKYVQAVLIFLYWMD